MDWTSAVALEGGGGFGAEGGGAEADGDGAGGECGLALGVGEAAFGTD